MRSVSDQDLVLYYYGESPVATEVADCLEGSAELRQRYASLSLVLDSIEAEPVPDRGPAYGSRIWHRVAPEIGETGGRLRGFRWLRPSRQWALGTVMAMLLIVAFLAGRWAPNSDSQVLAGLPSDGRERILLMTVAGHLERSEMLLLELVNTEENGDIDLSVERQLASELGRESRLYRQAAQQAGKNDVAMFLEQLETVLVELSHGPETVPSTDLGDLRLRLDEGDVLFKVRVLGSRLRNESDAPSRAAEDRPTAREI